MKGSEEAARAAGLPVTQQAFDSGASLTHPGGLYRSCTRSTWRFNQVAGANLLALPGGPRPRATPCCRLALLPSKAARVQLLDADHPHQLSGGALRRLRTYVIGLDPSKPALPPLPTR